MAEPIPEGGSEIPESPADRTISLLDIISILFRRKWLILVVTGAITVVVVAVAYLGKVLPVGHPLNFLPDVFTPEVDVLLQDGSSSSGTLNSLLNQSGLGSFAGLLGSSASRSTSAELAQYILSSDVLRDDVAKHFDFVSRYSIKNNPKTAGRRRVASALEFEYKAGPGVLSIRYTDTDRVFATEVVNWTVQYLEDQFRVLSDDRASEKMEDLSKRLSTAEEEVRAAREALIAFAERYGIVSIEAQAIQSEESLSELKTQRTNLQLEMNNVLRGGRGTEDPQVRALQGDIDEMDRLISEAERGWSSYMPSSIPAKEWPRVFSQYLDLQNEVTFRKGVYTLLLQSFETARQETLDQTSIFHVFRLADVPEVKSRPSRAKVCMIGAVAAFLLAVLMAFVVEYVDRARRDPEESRKLAEIRGSLRLRRTRPPQTPERY